jgi:Transmembrane secretion effector
MSGGEIAGPVLAGVLIATVGPGWALAVDAVSFAASAAFLARLRLPERVVREAGSFVADLREGWGMFRSLTWVWTFVLAAGVGNMLWGAWSALGPVVADRDLGGAAAWGTVLGAMGIGALIGSVAAVRVRPRRPLILAAATYSFFILPLLCLAARAPVAVVALGAMFGGVGMMLGNSVWESTLMREVPDEWLSRVSAYDWFGSLAFQPLGLAIWGPIAALIGLYPSLWVAGGLLVVTNVSLLSVPAIRQLRA